MIESNLKEGKQPHKDKDGSFRPKSELESGVSITDECVDLKTDGENSRDFAGCSKKT